jgi:transposase-like protein
MVQSLADVDDGRMRKIYTQSEREELVAAVKRGEPVPRAARRLGVKLPSAYAWLRRAESEVAPVAQQPTFLELVTAQRHVGLVVRVGTVEIEVRNGFDPNLLRAVVETLGGVA